MEITLRNGEKINLDWNPIVLEYLEDYEGGINQLKKDIANKNHQFRTFNFIVYCVISAIYPEELSYREAVSLVDINDLDKIVLFIVKNVSELKEIKPEETKQNIKRFPTNYNYKHRR